MADYNNVVFKSRKDSGYVIKFRYTSDKAVEEDKDRERTISRGGYICDWELTLDFHKTLYIRKTFNSLSGIKNAAHYFTMPWCHKEDFIAFIYKVNDYDFPCAAYVRGKFVELDKLSDEDRDTYRSYSGSYTEDISPLWTCEKEWKYDRM